MSWGVACRFRCLCFSLKVLFVVGFSAAVSLLLLVLYMYNTETAGGEFARSPTHSPTLAHPISLSSLSLSLSLSHTRTHAQTHSHTRSHSHTHVHSHTRSHSHTHSFEPCAYSDVQNYYWVTLSHMLGGLKPKVTKSHPLGMGGLQPKVTSIWNCRMQECRGAWAKKSHKIASHMLHMWEGGCVWLAGCLVCAEKRFNQNAASYGPAKSTGLMCKSCKKLKKLWKLGGGSFHRTCPLHHAAHTPCPRCITPEDVYFCYF